MPHDIITHLNLFHSLKASVRLQLHDGLRKVTGESAGLGNALTLKSFLSAENCQSKVVSYYKPTTPAPKKTLGDGLPCSLWKMMQMLVTLIRAGGTTMSTGGSGISGICFVPLKGDMTVRCRLILGTSRRLTSKWRRVPVDNFSFIQKHSTGLSVWLCWL